jgi:hypothetical protein
MKSLRWPGSPAVANLVKLRRNAGHLTSASDDVQYRRARPKLVDRVDATLGGDWWHAIWASGAPDRDDRILDGYIERLRTAAGGWAHAAIPVAQRADAKPVYVLVFLTQHPEGLWQFAEAVSLAHKAWTEFCRLHSPAGPGPGQLAFEGFDETADEDTEQAWIAIIATNIETLLADGRPFKVIDKMKQVYGETIGLARSMHVRAASSASTRPARPRRRARDRGWTSSSSILQDALRARAREPAAGRPNGRRRRREAPAPGGIRASGPSHRPGDRRRGGGPRTTRAV